MHHFQKQEKNFANFGIRPANVGIRSFTKPKKNTNNLKPHKMKIHGSIIDKKTALLVMRNHNRINKENRCFLIKADVNICFNSETKPGFLIATFK